MVDAHSEVESLWLPTDVTLGTGIRVTPITVTATATALGALLNTAVSGRTNLQGRRTLSIKNKDASATVYILERADQTITDGWEILAGATWSADASETFTQNIARISDITKGGGGFYLACASGTISAKVFEAK